MKIASKKASASFLILSGSVLFAAQTSWRQLRHLSYWKYERTTNGPAFHGATSRNESAIPCSP